MYTFGFVESDPAAHMHYQLPSMHCMAYMYNSIMAFHVVSHFQCHLSLKMQLHHVTKIKYICMYEVLVYSIKEIRILAGTWNPQAILPSHLKLTWQEYRHAQNDSAQNIPGKNMFHDSGQNVHSNCHVIYFTGRCAATLKH